MNTLTLPGSYLCLRVRHLLSLHQSGDGVVTWQFLGTPLA